MDLSEPTLHKEITCVMLAHMAKITYTMLNRSFWDNIAQENYLYSIGPGHTEMLLQENML